MIFQNSIDFDFTSGVDYIGKKHQENGFMHKGTLMSLRNNAFPWPLGLSLKADDFHIPALLLCSLWWQVFHRQPGQPNFQSYSTWKQEISR